jgi:hypothetical protein
MRRFVIVATLVSLFSGLAFSQTQDGYFNKNNITDIIVRDVNGQFWVTVLLNTQVNGFDGFYYYDFGSLYEAAYFADLFRRGRIPGVQHYTEASGKTGTWDNYKVATISRFYFK